MRTRDTVDHIFEICFDYWCKLRWPWDKGPQDIKKRVTEQFNKMDKNPLPIEYNGIKTYLNSFSMRGLFFDMAARPDLGNILTTTDVINSGLQGNLTRYLRHVEQSGIPFLDRKEAIIPIRCGDAYDHLGDHTDASLEADVRRALGKGASIIDYFIVIEAFICHGWTLEPPYKLTVPIGSPEPYNKAEDKVRNVHKLHDPTIDRPSAPMLISSNRYDAMTPLRNAVMASRQHKGSTLIIQEDYGHAVCRNAGQCVRKIIKDYFSHGVVPPNGTICEFDHPDNHATLPPVETDERANESRLESVDGGDK